MHSNNLCTLCQSETVYIDTIAKKEYFRCLNCHSIQMNPGNYVSYEEEKSIYEEHNNDVNDIRYQRFVSPIVENVLLNFNKSHLGLDFGAGTGPVITKMLNDEGYILEKYDPFFWNNEKVLKKKYDYIVCCEVIEHFHSPFKEFKLLKSLLNENGMLFLKTEIYNDNIVFKDWYYKNDSTHVFFYHEDSFKWIKDKLNFSSLKIDNRLITYTS